MFGVAVIILWIRGWSKLLDEVHFDAGDCRREEKDDQHSRIHLGIRAVRNVVD